MNRSLTLDDISDLVTYERERDAFRAHIIELKHRRRVGIGPFVTLLFENAETIRFQIQEMARVERLDSDAAIENELRAYNPLIPETGTLSATLFIELTTDDLLREWLPKLVGIERSIVAEVRDPNGDIIASIRCEPEAEHASHLTRDDITASVHYVHFALNAAEIDAFSSGSVVLASDHPAYLHSTAIDDEQRSELMCDLTG